MFRTLESVNSLAIKYSDLCNKKIMDRFGGEFFIPVQLVVGESYGEQCLSWKVVPGSTRESGASGGASLIRIDSHGLRFGGSDGGGGAWLVDPLIWWSLVMIITMMNMAYLITLFLLVWEILWN